MEKLVSKNALIYTWFIVRNNQEILCISTKQSLQEM